MGLASRPIPILLSTIRRPDGLPDIVACYVGGTFLRFLSPCAGVIGAMYIHASFSQRRSAECEHPHSPSAVGEEGKHNSPWALLKLS